MSKLKKLGSMLLALVFAIGMTCTAFAADGDYTITINNSTDGYTYVAYQIFAGTLSEDETTLSDVTWGSDVNTDAERFETTLTAQYGTTDAATIAAAITTTEAAAAFAEVIAPYVTGGTSSGTASPYTITVSEAGYYLVVNTVVPNGDYAYSDYILEVVDDVTVNPKATSTPDFDKTVGTSNDGDLADTNDATEDYAIGDAVPFTLTATLPDSISAYDTYKLVFTDTLSTGLTYDVDSLTVTVGGVTLTSDQYTLVVNGQTITVTITDVLSLELNGVTVGSGTEVVVSYTATLNEEAGSIESNKACLLLPVLRGRGRGRFPRSLRRVCLDRGAEQAGPL
ncbi:MAG: isopeptide-forming domain-containing fimbrial protein [Clostridiales bacterium]|nr:isopeptide-forming domain-containing fimbrial protein [Clostridiales bacterium]